MSDSACEPGRAGVRGDVDTENGAGSLAAVSSEGGRAARASRRRAGPPAKVSGRADDGTPGFEAGAPGLSLPLAIVGAGLVAIALWQAWQWPVASLWLVAGLMLYAGVLWRYPAAWLLLLPALVPVLNLALLSGRFLFDEFDLVVLTTVGVLLARGGRWKGFPVLPAWVRAAWWVYVLTVLIGLAATADQWVAALLDPTRFHYLDPSNALRSAKGVLWAACLVGLLSRSGADPGVLLKRWLVPGMVLGLAAVVMVVLWERATYPGLLDLDSRYRVTGLFTEMHTGGPSIETWLVITFPFLLLWAWQQRVWWAWLGASALVVAALYCLLVTYSRAGYVGLAVALMCGLGGALAAAIFARPAQRVRLLALGLLPVVLVAIALPQMTGSFFEQRMSRIAGDFELRQAHWDLALSLRGPGVLDRLFGEGPGAFPAAYARSRPVGNQPGNFALASDRDALRIGSGDSLYVSQRIGTLPAERFRVEIEAGADRAARLRVFVCEKLVKHSFQCRSGSVAVPGSATGDVGQAMWSFDATRLGIGPWFAQRTLVLALANQTRDSVIEIDRIRLLDESGNDWLRNGSFEQGLDHWYFTTGNLWPWRVENQWLEVLFDQGWVGLVAFSTLLVAGLTYLGRGALRGRLPDALVLGAVSGTMAIAYFSSVFWSPRIMLVFFVVLLLGMLASRAVDDARPPSPNG